jgi:uncharacterized protein (DUF433 family)
MDTRLRKLVLEGRGFRPSFLVRNLELRLMLKNSPIISASPEIMGGTPVFAGTRVPVQTLLDYLKAGESIDDFLDGFPTVTREQVIAFLEDVSKQLVGMVA